MKSLAVLLPVILLFYLTIIQAEPDCEKLCSREFADKELKNGTQKCGKNEKGEAAGLDSCSTECHTNKKFGKTFKEAENQTECFCDMCKNGMHFMFCEEIVEGEDKGLKSKEDCDKVCSGEAKYRWLFCKGKKNPFKG